ncbi:uncharacterized protein CXorf65 homolog [Emydura macquarii macquarii]|uniref:uncharacterized protein CXorf65 homolog n=1 Tax=Emydura macquarii macquarii TaxID=1129001 RepID=UPI00352B87FA
MFICVKHGENQQFLANTCCSVLLLLHYLRSKVGLRRTEPIDLCDELGTLKLLFLVKLASDSASKFLSPRGIYYVCRVARGAPGTKQENSYRAFTPILKDPEPELLDALRTQCEFLEKSRLKLLKAQDGKKIQTMESLISIVPAQISRIYLSPTLSVICKLAEGAMLPILQIIIEKAYVLHSTQGKVMGRPGPSAAGADEEGAPRKGLPPKIKPEASKKEKHR